MNTSLIILTTLTSFTFFFFNDTATTEIYTLSLHDALPICPLDGQPQDRQLPGGGRLWFLALPDHRECGLPEAARPAADRKSTRLNSSHLGISYAVFCLKKKKTHFFRHTRAIRGSANLDHLS